MQPVSWQETTAAAPALIMTAGTVSCGLLLINLSGASAVFNRSLLTFFFIVFLIYTGFCAYLYLYQRSLLYFGQPRRLENAPLMVLQRPGAKVMVTMLENDRPDALIYFGGNAEDVSMNLPDFAERFPNHALYLMHYRGYGGSEGKPSEQAIMDDAFALYDEVAKRHGRIVVAGRSLGTGVAVHLAAKRPASRVLLITPYDSIEYVAGRAFPYVPVRWLLKDKYESWRYAPEVSAPTLILMAEHDEVIPAESTERLYALFPEGIATLQVIPDSRHNSISASENYQRALTAFVNSE